MTHRPFLMTAALGSFAAVLAAATTVVGQPAAAERPSRPPVATVDLTDVKQEIEGFGAASQYFVRYMDALTPRQRERVFDVLFDSNKAAMTIMRHEAWSGGCDGDESVRCPDDRVGTKPNPLGHSMEPGEFELSCPPEPDPSGRCSPGRLRDHYQVWFHEQAEKRQPELLDWLNTHGAPEYMKQVPYDNSELRPDQWQAYADFMVRSVQAYRKDLGVEIEALSLANEPPLGYADKLVWPHAKLRDWTVENLIPTLERDNVDVDVMGLEDVSWRDLENEFRDPAATDALDIYASHAYSSDSPGGWQQNPSENCQTETPPTYALEAGMRVWMSECTLGPSTVEQAVRNARRIHEFFTGAQGNAWVWWRYVTGSDDSTLPDGRAGLVQINDKTGALDIKESVWTTAQFSRFVRPGWHRVDATEQPTPGVFVSAYTDPDSGELAVVAVNENPAASFVRLDLDGTGVDRLRTWRTSFNESLAAGEPVRLDDGEVTIRLRGQSVTTYVGAPR